MKIFLKRYLFMIVIGSIFIILILFLPMYFGSSIIVYLLFIYLFLIVLYDFGFLIFLRKIRMKNLAKELNSQYFSKSVRKFGDFLCVIKVKNIIINEDKKNIIFDLLYFSPYGLDTRNFFTVINGTIYLKPYWGTFLSIKDIKNVLNGKTDTYLNIGKYSYADDLENLQKFLMSNSPLKNNFKKNSIEEEKKIFDDYIISQKQKNKLLLILGIIAVTIYLVIFFK